MIPAELALERLKDGNRRYLAEILASGSVAGEERRTELVSRQDPFAIVLGCSDSRVPSELVFDQGLGDLFVVRVAGNVAAPSQIGSVEFAAHRFKTRLVVVLGHSSCGAVTATLDELQREARFDSPNIRSIVDRIRPAIEPLLLESGLDRTELLRRAVRANIRAARAELRSGSSVIERLATEEGLMIVGAEYCLGSGVVTFLDD